MLQDTDAVDLGYIEVEEQESWIGSNTWSTIRTTLVQIAETRFPVSDNVERIGDTMHPPGTLRRENVVLVVFHHESDQRLLWHRCLSLMPQRKCHEERTPLAWGRGDMHGAAHATDGFLDDSQADTCPLVLLLGMETLKYLENLLRVAWVDAKAIVAHV